MVTEVGGWKGVKGAKSLGMGGGERMWYATMNTKRVQCKQRAI